MKKIKVTHINPTDIHGGASLSGYRLHKEFLKDPDVDSVLFVNKKYTKDKEVVKFSNLFLRIINKVLNKLNYILGLQYFLNINWLPLFFYKRFWQTDVFIIRMIHGGYLPFWLPWLLSKIAPVIWRFPDMWAFTGHCAYSYDCQKFKEVCKKCPYLKEYPKLFIDTTSLLFKLKKFFYSRTNLHIICPSKWMLDNVNQSVILEKAEKYYVPTGVNIETFKPKEKHNKLGLITVSVDLKDKRKGGELFPKILSKLNQSLKEKNLFVDFYWIGEKDLSFPAFSNINNIFLGYLTGKDLARQYAKSHVYILPTLADNLPNTLLESLASGTPAVAFDVGGCSDVVKHLETGYLAKPYDINDFVRGIIKVLDNYQEMGRKGRELILNSFTMEKQAEKYLDLIKSIIYE